MSVLAKQIRLAQGRILLGGADGNAAAVTGTLGQSLIVNAAGQFEVRALTAADVTATAVANTNIDGTTVASQLSQLALASPYAHVGTADPTGDYDSADTAALGVVFKLNDEVINTATNAVYKAVDVTIGAAIWARIDNTANTQAARRELYTHAGGTQIGNVVLTGFFNFTPIANSESIHIGPLVLTWGTEYTITGLDLTLDMAAIGYALDDGDIVTARYTSA